MGLYEEAKLRLHAIGGRRKTNGRWWWPRTIHGFPIWLARAGRKGRYVELPTGRVITVSPKMNLGATILAYKANPEAFPELTTHLRLLRHR